MDAVQAFVQVESSSGILLLVAAIVALVWANSAFDDAYFDLLHTRLGFDLGFIALDEDLHVWVNDGLMTVFFYVVGLEIKRELVHGELASPRRALLPAAAAIGGMAVPALIYIAFNLGGDGARGWGVPMATDIAFALGVLSLLGRRVPFSIKVFLLALAIADDIGAILVIAVFYTSQIDAEALAAAASVLALVVAFSRAGIRSVGVYVGLGLALWLAVFESGIHATLTGVALGLLTPASPLYAPSGFVAAAEDLVRRFREGLQTSKPDDEQHTLAQIEELTRGTEAPLDRLERVLHPWVSYAIVPLFALANAGVVVSSDVARTAIEGPVSQGVTLGLVLGKPAGILLFTWLAVRLRLGQLPAGATWGHIFGVGLLGGIGFTVSLLIASLAFDDAALVDEAKLGVLSASLIAGATGFVYLFVTNRSSSEAVD